MADKAHAAQSSHPLTVVAGLQVTLEVSHILEGQGVPPGKASPAVVAVAEEVLAEAQSLLAPAALYTRLPVRAVEHEQILLDGGAVFAGPLATRVLAGASEAVAAVCTIGPALEERSAALFAAGYPLQGLAMDGAGTAAIRLVAGAVGVRICDEATDRGLSVGMSADPGQEGWPITQQRVLFGLLPAEQIGVHLTDSCLMLPRKSVSFVVGLGPDMRADAVPCDFCSKRERCRWSRQKADAEKP
jgi:hypothetical protein